MAAVNVVAVAEEEVDSPVVAPPTFEIKSFLIFSLGDLIGGVAEREAAVGGMSLDLIPS